MVRTSVIGLIMAIAIIAACFLLLPGSISSAYASKYSTTPYGIVLSSLHVAYSEFSNVNLLIWIIAGAIIGLAMRSGKKGFATAFWASLFIFLAFYPLSILSGMASLPYTMYGQFDLISGFLFPLVANWVVGGFGGLIGGRISRLIPKKALELEGGRVLEALPIKCPHCGHLMYSNSSVCANCGKELRKKK